MNALGTYWHILAGDHARQRALHTFRLDHTAVLTVCQALP